MACALESPPVTQMSGGTAASPLFPTWQRDGTCVDTLIEAQARADAKGLITWDVSVDSIVARSISTPPTPDNGDLQRELPGGPPDIKPNDHDSAERGRDKDCAADQGGRGSLGRQHVDLCPSCPPGHTADTRKPPRAPSDRFTTAAGQRCGSLSYV
jgi:hypothetical protein